MYKVIGEGSYGCVHKPSLICKDKDIKYKNKVSKLMKTENAEIELSEYDKIMEVDNNEDFFISKPEICVPKLTVKNLMSIEKCRDFNIINIDDYSLLVIPDGGMDLNKFVENIKTMENNKHNRDKIMEFWLSGHVLLKGIKEMLEKSIIHHDLKPGNIVYDPKTNKLKFIDFGFMDYTTNIIEKLGDSEHSLARPYWYFPFELSLLNRKVFNKVSKSKDKKRRSLFNNLIKNKIYDTESHMEMFYLMVDDDDVFIKENTQIFYNFFMSLKKDQYNNYIEKTVNSIDIYGLGVSFLYVLNNCKRLMDNHIWSDFRELFKTMISASLDIRPNIDELLQRYELILESSAIKRSLYFSNNKLQKHDKTLKTLLKSLNKTIKKYKGVKKYRESLLKDITKLQNTTLIANTKKKGMI